MSVIILAVEHHPFPGHAPWDTAVAGINGGRRDVVFQGAMADAVNVLETRLAELSEQGHSIVVALVRPGPSGKSLAAKVRSVCAFHGVRLAMQTPRSECLIASDRMLRKVELWSQPSEINHPPVHHVNDTMRHALLAMSRYFPDHFAAMVAYAGEEATR